MKWYWKGLLFIVVALVALWLWNLQSNGHDVRPAGYIALTFDDGPHDIYTKMLLDGLRKRNVQVSFFLLGENIGGNERLISQMHADGHLIGNHTYRHVQMTTTNPMMACDYVAQTNEMICEITGATPEYLRPPYGDWNENLDCMTEMKTVFWSVDSKDWYLQDSAQIVNHVVKRAGDADIILMHDIFPTSVEAALEIVDRLQADGYVFVTVDELLID